MSAVVATRKPISASARRPISASSAEFTGRESAYLLDCLSRSWITQGKYVEMFEQEIAKMAGTRFAFACSSGTSALHLAYLAAGVGEGDAVIVPTLTYVATANAARYCGAEVLFADVDPGDWTIDYRSALSLRTLYLQLTGHDVSAVVPVHLYDALATSLQFPRELVIEDAAHAPGASDRNSRRVGTFGKIAAFSFYASKVIATGEGGAVVTDDELCAKRVRLLRGQGATTPGRYHHSVIGYNYRMTDLQAAVGLAQIEHLSSVIERRRIVIGQYRANLGTHLDKLALQRGVPGSGWTFAIVLADRYDRDTIAEILRIEYLIETRPFFQPLHTLPPYVALARKYGISCPIAEGIAAQGLCLPTYPGLTTSDVDYVCESLIDVLAKNERKTRG